jgi:O-antigen/teichoic acid export membrane protein
MNTNFNKVVKSFYIVTSVVLSLLSTVIIMRQMEVDDRGFLQLLIIIGQMACLFGMMGVPFSEALLESKSNTSSTTYKGTFFVFSSSCLSGFLLFFYYNVDLTFNNCFFVFSIIVQGYLLERTKSIKYEKLHGFIYFLHPLLLVVFSGVWLFFGYGFSVVNVQVIYILSSFIILFFSVFSFEEIICKKRFLIRRKIILSLKNWINQVFSFAANNVDKIFIVKVMDNYTFGIYTALFIISSVVMKFSDRLSVLSLIFFQQKTVNVKNLVIYISITILIIYPVVVLIVTNWSDLVLSLLIGDEYTGYSLVLVNIIMSSIISSASWNLAQLLISKSKILHNLIRTLGSTTVFMVSIWLYGFDNEDLLLNTSLSLIYSSTYKLLATFILVLYYEKKLSKITQD